MEETEECNRKKYVYLKDFERSYLALEVNGLVLVNVFTKSSLRDTKP